jgi:hypothetical protein
VSLRGALFGVIARSVSDEAISLAVHTAREIAAHALGRPSTQGRVDPRVARAPRKDPAAAWRTLAQLMTRFNSGRALPI